MYNDYNNSKGDNMSVTINIYYKGENGNARKFAEEMCESGIVSAIRNEKGNLKYDYFFPMNDPETLLLIDCWESQQALDIHHESPMMREIARLREKYQLTMRVERFISDTEIPESDKKFIRK